MQDNTFRLTHHQDILAGHAYGFSGSRCDDVQLKRARIQDANKSKNESENHFVFKKEQGFILADFWFLEMFFWHQATLESEDSP